MNQATQHFESSGWELTKTEWIDDQGKVYATKDKHGYWTRHDGRIICGSIRSVKVGLPCNASPLKQSTRCRNHGGKSLKGVAHPNYVDGGWSKYMPKRMVTDYQDAISDPELLAMRRGLALSQARLLDLLKRVDTGESGQRWKEARTAYEDMRVALRMGDQDAAREHMTVLGNAIRAGQSDYAAWREIQHEMELMRRMSESEQKRLVFMQQNITVEQMMMNVQRLGKILQDRIHDPNLLRLISSDIAALMQNG